MTNFLIVLAVRGLYLKRFLTAARPVRYQVLVGTRKRGLKERERERGGGRGA
jgi:hypothetical protein